MMFTWLHIQHVHTLGPDARGVAGESGGGLAIGWTPRAPSQVFGWTVVSDSQGLTTYCFREMRDAVLAYQMSQECEGVGPKMAATLLGQHGTMALARAVRAGDKSSLKKVGPKTLTALQGFFAKLTLEEDGSAVSASTLQATLQGMGFGAQEIQEASTFYNQLRQVPTLQNLLSRIRNQRAATP